MQNTPPHATTPHQEKSTDLKREPLPASAAATATSTAAAAASSPSPPRSRFLTAQRLGNRFVAQVTRRATSQGRSSDSGQSSARSSHSGWLSRFTSGPAVMDVDPLIGQIKSLAPGPLPDSIIETDDDEPHGMTTTQTRLSDSKLRTTSRESAATSGLGSAAPLQAENLHTTFATHFDAESHRVRRLRDMEGLFFVRTRIGSHTSADTSGDDAGALSQMLRDRNWKLRYLKLTNNLNSGGGIGPLAVRKRSFRVGARGSSSSFMGSSTTDAGSWGSRSETGENESSPRSLQRSSSNSGFRSGRFDPNPEKSVVDVNAGILEIYRVDVNNVDHNYCIREKVLSIPVKKVSFVKRGQVSLKHAMVFPTEGISSEYKYGQILLQLFIDQAALGKQSLPGMGIDLSAITKSVNDSVKNFAQIGGGGDGQSTGASHEATSQGAANASSHAGELSTPSMPSSSTQPSREIELELCLNTAKERDLWYDWVSSFILHADMTDLHTDIKKPPLVYRAKKPHQSHVHMFVNFFLQGAKKKDSKDSKNATTIPKVPANGDLVLVLGGENQTSQCRFSCVKLGEATFSMETAPYERMTIVLSTCDIIALDALSQSFFLRFSASGLSRFRSHFRTRKLAFGKDFRTLEFKAATPYDRDKIMEWLLKIKAAPQPRNVTYPFEFQRDAEDDLFTFRSASPQRAGREGESDEDNSTEGSEEQEGDEAQDAMGFMSRSTEDWGEGVDNSSLFANPHALEDNEATIAATSGTVLGHARVRGIASASAAPPGIRPRYARVDPRSVLARTPVVYYRSHQKSKEELATGVTLNASFAKDSAAHIGLGTSLLTHVAMRSFLPVDVVHCLLNPVSSGGLFLCGEIGMLPNAAEDFFVKGVFGLDYAAEVIYLLSGANLEKTVANIFLQDITAVSVYSKVFGTMGITLHCLREGIEVTIIPQSGSDVLQWLQSLETLGVNIKASKSREEINERYLRELCDEHAKLDAMRGPDEADNTATLLPCALCGRSTYVCDVLGTFHPDAVRRLASVATQQSLQQRKSLLLALEDDFATSSEEDEDDQDDVNGNSTAGESHFYGSGTSTSFKRALSYNMKQLSEKANKKKKSNGKNIVVKPPSMADWILTSLPPVEQELSPLTSETISASLKSAQSAVHLAQASLKNVNLLFGTH